MEPGRKGREYRLALEPLGGDHITASMEPGRKGREYSSLIIPLFIRDFAPSCERCRRHEHSSCANLTANR